MNAKAIFDPEAIMKLALIEARLAVKDGNAPFACIVTNEHGKVILKEHDRVAELTDPTAHGEVNAIRKLCKQLKSRSLRDYIFFTTSEPCPLCMSAMIKARVAKVYFGAPTEISASLPIPAQEIADRSVKFPISVIPGILADECTAERNQLLGTF